MRKQRIFISSVQNEFEKERFALLDYFNTDVLLKSFFEPFIFEKIAANTKDPENVFKLEVKRSDIYLGLFGKEYGYEDRNGISPTQMEYETAKNKGIPRWIYILKTNSKRHPKEENLIKKVSGDVSWKYFAGIKNLKKEVYHTCIEFLKQKGKIENNEFDYALQPFETINGIDESLLRDFIVTAREKRNFPEKKNAPVIDVLKKLNLYRNEKIVNSAFLVFSNNPQQYFPSATVKCAYFHGIKIQKPIPDYKEFGGNILEMADSAVDFVLSKINLSTGTRNLSNQVETNYEIPRSVIAEAVINALAHRDYYSKGSVQISVFKDRIEFENPGCLPNEINLEDLKKPHASYPPNPLLANCLFLVGAIERYGTGTLEIIEKTTAKGLAEPVFTSHNTFKLTIWRSTIISDESNKQEQVGEQVREQVREQVSKVILILNGEQSASEIMKMLNLKARRNFLQNYLQPAIEAGYIEMTQPKSPKSPTQKYRVTDKGKWLRKE